MNKVIFCKNSEKSKILKFGCRARLWFGMVMTTAWMQIFWFPAFADGLTVDDSKITTMLGTTIDIVFQIFSVGIGVMGVFQLVPAVIHFIQASNSQNGEQRKEAGSGIGTAVMLLLLAGLVFMLKAPVKNLVGLT